jgi:hypothetical protein
VQYKISVTVKSIRNQQLSLKVLQNLQFCHLKSTVINHKVHVL